MNKKTVRVLQGYVLSLGFLCLISTSIGVAETLNFDGNWGPPGVQLVSQKDSGVEIVYSMGSLRIEQVDYKGETMQTLAIQGVFLPNDAGAPNLPGTGRYIAIPQGAGAKLEVMETRTRVLRDMNIAPAPAILREDDTSTLVCSKDSDIYETDGFYPREPIALSRPLKMRGMDVVILGINPFQYNPVSKELVVYTDVRIRVTYTGDNGHFGEDRYRSRYWEPVLRANLLNYTSLLKVDFHRRALSKNTGYEYVIVVPNDSAFIAWADTIRHWRNLQGISTEVFTLAEIGYSPYDIESWIDSVYTHWDVPPVAMLLLSDYPYSGKAYGIPAFVWDDYCVSDNVFADVDEDGLPELTIARLTAQDADDLEEMVTKFLDYERNPYTDADFYDKPVLAGAWRTDRWYILSSEITYGFLANELDKDPVREYAIQSGTPDSLWSTGPVTYVLVDYFGPDGLGYIPESPEHLTDWGANATRLNADINSGCFILQHRGWGDDVGWEVPDYDMDDLDGLSNEMLPFVFSINSLTGMFNYDTEVFTEKFHRMEHGALGLIAPSAGAYSFVSDVYLFGIYDGMWPKFDPGYPSGENAGVENLRPGFAQASAKYYLEASNWPCNGPYKEVTYHLFHTHGDAFTTLYSEVPESLLVTHPSVMFADVPSFPMTAPDGSVIALTVDGEIIGVADGDGGTIEVPIVPQSAPDTMLITVTKFNHYRYSQRVPIVPQESAVVLHLQHGVDDDSLVSSSGNSDGIINPGESIELVPFFVKNYGADTAFAVQGVLSIQAPYPYVTLIDSLDSYGTIFPGGSKLSLGGFVFQVDLAAPDGHEIDFVLECADGDSLWRSYFSELVSAPVLRYVSHQIDDTEEGDGDGRIELGETVDLTMTIENSGTAGATGISGTIASLHPHVEVATDSADFPDLNPECQGASMTDFTIHVDSLCPVPSQAFIEISLASTRGYTYQDTFVIKLGRPKVLFVDDDQGDPVEVYFTNALDDLSVAYDVWTVTTSGSPSSADMEEYFTVIWSTGRAISTTLDSTDEANLMAYLDGGGSLFLSSHWYLYDIGSATTFSSDYLHVSSWADEDWYGLVEGVSGDPISDGLSYDLLYVYWSNMCFKPDRIVPKNSAAGIFKILSSKEGNPVRSTTDGACGGSVEIEFEPMEENFRVYKYSALRFPAEVDSSYKVVFLAFPFDAVPTSEDRADLMQRILDWLYGADQPPQVYVLVPNGGEIWAVGTEHDIDWTATDVSSVDSISIFLSMDGGDTFPHAICHGKPNVSPYTWIVPPIFSDSAMIKVIAHDAHGNVGWDISDSLFAIVDSSPPEEIDDLTAELAGGAVRLWWSEPYDDVAVTRYVVYRNTAAYCLGDSLAGTTDTVYSDLGVVGDVDTNYFYMVKAVDGADNKSEESNEVGEFDKSLSDCK